MRVRELQITYRRRPDLPTIDGRKSLTCPRNVVELLRAILETEPVEVCAILCLTTLHHFLAYHKLSRGSLGETVVHVRDVFKAALLANSAAIVLAHNHPSGDPIPSHTDLALTRCVARAGEIVGGGRRARHHRPRRSVLELPRTWAAAAAVPMRGPRPRVTSPKTEQGPPPGIWRATTAVTRAASRRHGSQTLGRRCLSGFFVLI